MCCELPADAAPAPFAHDERAELRDVIHRVNVPRPQVETLEADDLLLCYLCEKDSLARGRRFQVLALSFNCKGTINCRIYFLCNNRLPDGDDACRVIRRHVADRNADARIG